MLHILIDLTILTKIRKPLYLKNENYAMVSYNRLDLIISSRLVKAVKLCCNYT